MTFREIIKSFIIFGIFITVFCATFLFASSFLSSDVERNLSASVSAGIGIEEKSNEVVLVKEVEKEAEPILEIEALSAISVDFSKNRKERILFSKNSKEVLPTASLAKLMTALVVMKRYDLSQEVVISRKAMEQIGEQGVLKEGEVLTIENLLYITLIESSNRAAFAISEVLGKEGFIGLMNDEAKTLGLSHTHFEDSAGLNGKTYSTVEDLAKLSQHLFLNYPLFLKIVGNKEYDLYLPDGTFHHKLVNTNEFLGRDHVVVGKTGYTHEAQGCYMVIQKIDEDNFVVNIILGAVDRSAELQKLINISSDIRNKTLIGG